MSVMNSELMRSIVVFFHFFYDHSKHGKAFAASPGTASEDLAPWDNVYPKGKDGFPMYNSSGKYAVKLFWLGAWRKIMVDDKIPVDSTGKPLLVSSPNPNEIWPMILSKAIIKVASTSYKENENFPEAGDVDVFTLVKGWLPEKFNLNTFTPSSILWSNLSTLPLKTALPTSGNLRVTSPPANPISSPGTANPLAKPPILSYNTVFAWKSGEENGEKIDLALTPFVYRVVEFKEGLPDQLLMTLNNDTTFSAGIDEGFDESRKGEKYVKIKKYFSCGFPKKAKNILESKNVQTPKIHEVPVDLKTAGKSSTEIEEKSPEVEPAIIHSPIVDDGTEFWISFNEFCNTFKYLCIYHNPNSFKHVKNIFHINDAAKPNDNLRILPVLYINESQNKGNLMISLHAYGKSKPGSFKSASTIMLLEKWDWKGGITLNRSIPSEKTSYNRSSQADKLPVLKMATNACAVSFVNIRDERSAYRFNVDCPTSYVISVLSKEDPFYLEDESKYLTDKLGLQVRDIEDTFPQITYNGWFILYKHIFHIPPNTSTTILALLYGPEAIQQSLCVRMFDNDGPNNLLPDSGATIEVPQAFYLLKPQLCQPNKNGYTLIADCRSNNIKPGSKWKIRLILDNPLSIFSPEKPLEGLSLKPIVQDFEEPYTPNRHNLLFRYIVKVKDAGETLSSIQLNFSLPFIVVKLQLFDYDVEIASAKGKGVTTIHAVNIFANSPDGDSPPVPFTHSKKGDNKEKDKETKPGTPYGSSPPKHKYILQGTVDPVELVKYMATFNFAGNNAQDRPSSRGLKVPGSGKKKKGGNTQATTLAAANEPPVAAASTNNGPSMIEPAWKLRIISTDNASLMITKDTEKEDRHRAIKEQWEQTQPGRAAKAREARESYIKLVEQGTQRNHTFGVYGPKKHICKPWTILNQIPLSIPELLPSDAIDIARAESSANSILNLEQREDDTLPLTTILSSVSVAKKRPSTVGSAKLKAKLEEQVLKMEEQNNSKDEEYVPVPNLPRPHSSSNPQQVITKWPSLGAGPAVLSSSEILQRDEIRAKQHADFLEAHENILKLRTQDREQRSVIRLHQATTLEERQKETEGFVKVDLLKREKHKQMIAKQIEEGMARKTANLEALRLAELGVEAGAIGDDEKSKKKNPVAVKK